MNFKKELESMRKKFAKKPPAMVFTPRPSWLTDDDCEDARIYREKDELLANGTVCWACVVQANQLLFRDTPRVDCPANLLYSDDESVCNDPTYLLGLCDILFMYKDRDPENIPSEWQDIAAKITAEKGDCYSSVSTVLNNKPVKAYFNANMIFRNLLPEARLQGRILPVLAIPGKCVSVLVLPHEYWSKSFKKAWIKGEFQ